MDSSPDLSIKLPKGESSPESTYMDFGQGIASDIEKATAQSSAIEQLSLDPVQIDPPSPILPPPSLDSISTDGSEKGGEKPSIARDSFDEDKIPVVEISSVKPELDEEEEDDDEDVHSIILNQQPEVSHKSHLEDILKSLDSFDEPSTKILVSQQSDEDELIRSLTSPIPAPKERVSVAEDLPAPPDFPPPDESYR